MSNPGRCRVVPFGQHFLVGNYQLSFFLVVEPGIHPPRSDYRQNKKRHLEFPARVKNYNSLLLIWRRGLRSPLFRRLSAGWGMHRSAMSLDLPASLSRPNVIREDLPKHHLVIIKINIQYNHRKEYLKKTVTYQGRTPGTVVQFRRFKKEYIPLP